MDINTLLLWFLAFLAQAKINETWFITLEENIGCCQIPVNDICPVQFPDPLSDY